MQWLCWCACQSSSSSLIAQGEYWMGEKRKPTLILQLPIFCLSLKQESNWAFPTTAYDTLRKKTIIITITVNQAWSFSVLVMKEESAHYLMAEVSLAVLSVRAPATTSGSSSSDTPNTDLSLSTSLSDFLYSSSSPCTASATVGNGLLGRGGGTIQLLQYIDKINVISTDLLILITLQHFNTTVGWHTS